MCIAKTPTTDNGFCLKTWFILWYCVKYIECEITTAHERVTALESEVLILFDLVQISEDFNCNP